MEEREHDFESEALNEALREALKTVNPQGAPQENEKPEHKDDKDEATKNDR